MKILGKRILASEFKQDTETESGIIIPEVAQKDEKNLFEIVAVGTEVKDKDLVEGNVILVGNRTSKAVDSAPLGGTDFKIFNEDQIIGVDNGG